MAGAVFAAAAVLALAGCSSTIVGQAHPATETGTIDAVDTSAAPTPDDAAPTTSSAPTSTPTETTEQGGLSLDAEIGDCVSLGGSTSDATIDAALCGSGDSNYKVVGRAERSTQCVSDVDNYYAESRNGVELGALCLDIDWVVGGCMDVGTGTTGPARIDCTTTTATDGVKVVAIEENADEVAACDAGTSGYVYPERRFVVCVDEL